VHHAMVRSLLTFIPSRRARRGHRRFTINKTIRGDLEATTIGEMFTGGDPPAGRGGYVAIEVVTERSRQARQLRPAALRNHGRCGPKMQVI